MNTLVLLRVIHVLSIILWIGGVAMVTTVLLPALRRMDHTGNPIDLFERIEGSFGLPAKFTTVLAGASGFLLLHLSHGWSRYLDVRFWWVHLMTLVWLLFTVVLFVLEPLVLHRWFREHGAIEPHKTLARVHRLHIVLLRRSPFYPAMVASTHQATVKAFKDELIERGTQPRVTVTAVMRELLHCIHGMWATDTLQDRDRSRGPQKIA